FADVLLGKMGQRQLVERAFDDDLMSADAVHLVVDALAAFVEVAFNLQDGKLVGYDADAPTALIGARIAVAIRQDLVGSIPFLAFTERAQARTGRHWLDLRPDRPFGPVGGNDHPAPDNRILTQLRHG